MENDAAIPKVATLYNPVDLKSQCCNVILNNEKSLSLLKQSYTQFPLELYEDMVDYAVANLNQDRLKTLLDGFAYSFYPRIGLHIICDDPAILKKESDPDSDLCHSGKIVRMDQATKKNFIDSLLKKLPEVHKQAGDILNFFNRTIVHMDTVNCFHHLMLMKAVIDSCDKQLSDDVAEFLFKNGIKSCNSIESAIQWLENEDEEIKYFLDHPRVDANFEATNQVWFKEKFGTNNELKRTYIAYCSFHESILGYVKKLVALGVRPNPRGFIPKSYNNARTLTILDYTISEFVAWGTTSFLWLEYAKRMIEWGGPEKRDENHAYFQIISDYYTTHLENDDSFDLIDDSAYFSHGLLFEIIADCRVWCYYDVLQILKPFYPDEYKEKINENYESDDSDDEKKDGD